MSILEKLKPRVDAMKELPIYKRMKEDADKGKREIVQNTCSKELANDGVSKARCGGCNKHMYERLVKQLERLRKAKADADAESSRRRNENNQNENNQNENNRRQNEANATTDADAENNGVVSETNEFPDEDYTFPENSLGVGDPEETLPADNTLLMTVILKHLQDFNNMIEHYDKLYYAPDVEAAATLYDQTKSDMALEQMWSFHFHPHMGKNDIWFACVQAKPVARFCNNAVTKLLGGKASPTSKDKKKESTPNSSKKRKSAMQLTKEDRIAQLIAEETAMLESKTYLGRYFERVVSQNKGSYLSSLRNVSVKICGLTMMDDYLQRKDATLWIDETLQPKNVKTLSTRSVKIDYEKHYLSGCPIRPVGFRIGTGSLQKAWQPLVENRKMILLLGYNSRFPFRGNHSPMEPPGLPGARWYGRVERQLLHFRDDLKVFEDDQVAYQIEKEPNSESRYFTASAGVGKINKDATDLLRLSIVGETGYDYDKPVVIGNGENDRLTRRVISMKNHPEWIYNVVYRSEQQVTGLTHLLRNASPGETDKVRELETDIKKLAKFCLLGTRASTEGVNWTVDIVNAMICATRDYRCENHPVVPLPGMTVNRADLNQYFPHGRNGGRVDESTNKVLLEFILPLDMQGVLVHMKKYFNKDDIEEGTILTSMIFGGTVLVFGPETHTNSFNRSTNTGSPHIKGFLVCRKDDPNFDIPQFRVGDGCLPAGFDHPFGLTVPTPEDGSRNMMMEREKAEKWFTTEKINEANSQIDAEDKALLGLLSPEFCRLLCAYTLPTMNWNCGLERNKPAEATMPLPSEIRVADVAANGEPSEPTARNAEATDRGEATGHKDSDDVAGDGVNDVA